MKRFAQSCGIVATFLCLAQNAHAQYLPSQPHRDRAGFVDEHVGLTIRF